MADGNENAVVSVSAGRFPYIPALGERYGIDKANWRALTDAIFPNAKTLDAILLALSYCKARQLDVFKRPINIVPMWSKELGRMVDTIWPGIGELRTTAARTREYAGREPTIWGPEVEVAYGGVKVIHPEWAEVVVYRIVGGVRCPFHGPRVYWRESYATKKHDTDEPNSMWLERPMGQLEKCAEAAALRTAFPEECGNQLTSDEMEGRVIVGEVDPALAHPRTPARIPTINASQARKNGVYERLSGGIKQCRTTEELVSWREANCAEIAVLPRGDAGDWSEIVLDEWQARHDALASNEEAPTHWTETAGHASPTQPAPAASASEADLSPASDARPSWTEIAKALAKNAGTAQIAASLVEAQDAIDAITIITNAAWAKRNDDGAAKAKLLIDALELKRREAA